MYAIMQGLTFGAAIGIIIYGVRMILAELVPAFQGIAQSLIPNAVPALDCPTVFPYAPNAVVIGFIFSVIGGIVGYVFGGPLGTSIDYSRHDSTLFRRWYSRGLWQLYRRTNRCCRGIFRERTFDNVLTSLVAVIHG